MVRFAVTLVRHGETRYNKERLLQGQGIDEPLSEMGFRQADAAGRFLNGVRFTHAFSSDLIRAKQTATTILGESRMCKDLKINLDARLRERKYGVAEGKPLSELKTRAKAAGQQCPKYTPPGGETLDEVKARAKDFFDFLCQLALEDRCSGGNAGLTGNGFESTMASTFSSENHGGAYDFHPEADSDEIILDANILVVSHGAFLRIWMKYFLEDLQSTVPSTLKKSRELSVSPNTGISHFIVELQRGETVKPQITCVCINRHDHLLEVEAGADV
ncbi:fructose-2,6-bisphosphatase TIGAR isoform X2 [Lissotriton helveticus]